ncbi:MAG: hypothetical protein JWO33_855 [Caulobacteraceae bacterium]|nr:hypothetical protein [Caulobacteraceae bacterium]
MPSKLAAVVGVAFALAVPGVAGATTYTITVHGVLESRLSTGTNDTRFHVGDQYTLSAQFTDAYVIPWGAAGFRVSGGAWVSGPPGTGILPSFGASEWLRIEGDGLGGAYGPGANESGKTNRTNEAVYKGPGLTALYGPGLAFTDTQLLSIGNFSYENIAFTLDQSGTLLAFLHFDYWPTYNPQQSASFPTIPTIDTFTVFARCGVNVPGACTGTYLGRWDLANATILVDGVNLAAASVPEPSTWAALILGFGGIGTLLRVRRRRLALP